MSGAAPGPGWWLASDGKWYPPSDADRPPAPGWWLAADGKWYPPKEDDASPGPGWWLASDGKWYAPEERTGGAGGLTDAKPTAAPKGRSRRPSRSKAKSGGNRSARRRAAKAQAPTEPVDQKPTQATSPSSPAATMSPAEPTLVAGRDRIRPNANEGVSPLEQIERRNQASRADAQVLATKRAQAASRALGGLDSMINAELAARKVEDVFTGPTAPPPAVPSATERAPDRHTAAETESPTTDNTPEGSPLLEVKAAAPSDDREHAGERLAIFVDRVEMRDRLDRVRQSINGDDIIDVVVQTRLTGVVLTIESVRGPGIAAKGLRPEQAEEARRLIMTKTRPARMAAGNGAHAARESAATTGAVQPANTRKPAAATPAGHKIDVADLRSKLADLRRVGLLTEDEYAQKLARLAQLAEDPARTRSMR